jgi:hypothetical protein
MTAVFSNVTEPENYRRNQLKFSLHLRRGKFYAEFDLDRGMSLSTNSTIASANLSPNSVAYITTGAKLPLNANAVCES